MCSSQPCQAGLCAVRRKNPKCSISMLWFVFKWKLLCKVWGGCSEPEWCWGSRGTNLGRPGKQRHASAGQQGAEAVDLEKKLSCKDRTHLTAMHVPGDAGQQIWSTADLGTSIGVIFLLRLVIVEFSALYWAANLLSLSETHSLFLLIFFFFNCANVFSEAKINKHSPPSLLEPC